MNPVVEPQPVIELDWSYVIGPVLFASALTLIGTVALHFLSAWRENRYRFTTDRRSAYVEAISMASRLQHINAQVRRVGQKVAAWEVHYRENPGDKIAENHLKAAKLDLNRLRDQMDDILPAMLNAGSSVDLLAPENIARAVRRISDMPIDDLCSEPGRRAIDDAVKKMRADLGVKDDVWMIRKPWRRRRGNTTKPPPPSRG